MVKPTQDIARDNATATFDGPVIWRIFPQGEMGGAISA
jgi:hypothetical protein